MKPLALILIVAVGTGCTASQQRSLGEIATGLAPVMQDVVSRAINDDLDGLGEDLGDAARAGAVSGVAERLPAAIGEVIKDPGAAESWADAGLLLLAAALGGTGGSYLRRPRRGQPNGNGGAA